MARGKSRLAPGLTITDYSTPARIRESFGSEKAIRQEYTRQRDIMRKRVGRLESAGERDNWVYSVFGDFKSAMPEAKTLSTDEMMHILAVSSRVLSGAYQSTLREIKASREEQIEAMRAEAEAEGDEETAEALAKGLSSAQFARLNRVTGMIERIVGRNIDTKEVRRNIVNTIVQAGSKRSLLSIAAQVINDLDIGNEDSISQLSSRFTAKGTTRVSWAKAHSNRR